MPAATYAINTYFLECNDSMNSNLLLTLCIILVCCDSPDEPPKVLSIEEPARYGGMTKSKSNQKTNLLGLYYAPYKGFLSFLGKFNMWVTW